MTSNPNRQQNKEAARAYYYACRLLARRDYTAHEISSKLRQKKYGEEVAGKVIEKFIERGFLDDEAFIGKYVRTRALLKPRGEYLLKIELRKKGVSEDLISSYFESNPVDKVETARNLLERNARSLMKLAPERRKQKILYLLKSRGLSCNYSEFGLPGLK